MSVSQQLTQRKNLFFSLGRRRVHEPCKYMTLCISNIHNPSKLIVYSIKQTTPGQALHEGSQKTLINWAPIPYMHHKDGISTVTPMWSIVQYLGAVERG